MQTTPIPARPACPHRYDGTVIVRCPWCAGTPCGFTSYRRMPPAGGRRSARIAQRRRGGR